MKQSIVHAAPIFMEYGGNFLASLEALRESCEARDWSLSLALPETASEREWYPRLVADGWRVHLLPVAGSQAGLVRSLVRVVRQDDCRLLHTHFTLYDSAAWMAAHIGRSTGKRIALAWHIHSELNTSRSPARWAKNALKYRWMGGSAWLLPVGDSVLRGLVDVGAPADRVRLVPNGIDLARAVARTEDDHVRSRLGLGDSDLLVLMFGIDPLNKGVDLVLDAMARLRVSDPRIVLGIVGRQKLSDHLRQRMGSVNPDWLRVIRPVECVGDLYGAATAFVSASFSEGFPYAIGEAMACGLPVILSDIPGVAWARRSPGALFFPSGDSHVLAECIREVAAWSTAERHERARANRLLAETELDMRIWARRIVELYEEILA